MGKLIKIPEYLSLQLLDVILSFCYKYCEEHYNSASSYFYDPSSSSDPNFSKKATNKNT